MVVSSQTVNSIPYQFKEIIFDAGDIREILEKHNNSIQELRTAALAAEKKSLLARGDHNTHLELFYSEYSSACWLGIEILRSIKPINISQEIKSSKFVDLDELKSRFDIVDIASRYCRLIKAGNTYKALCPFHPEKSPSFFIYPDRQLWKCFGACNTGGDILSLLMKAENVDFKQAICLLEGWR